jgi:hypothetical protein
VFYYSVHFTWKWLGMNRNMSYMYCTNTQDMVVLCLTVFYCMCFYFYADTTGWPKRKFFMVVMPGAVADLNFLYRYDRLTCINRWNIYHIISTACCLCKQDWWEKYSFCYIRNPSSVQPSSHTYIMAAEATNCKDIICWGTRKFTTWLAVYCA